MQKKHILKASGNEEFLVFGMVTPLAGFRLWFFLNKSLGIRLSRIEDFLPADIATGSDPFQLYAFTDELRQNEWLLLANKSSGQVLLPSLKQVDFFLLTDGLPHNLTSEHLISLISRINQVQFTQKINPSQIKGIDILLEDIEMHLMLQERNRKTPTDNSERPIDD